LPLLQRFQNAPMQRPPSLVQQARVRDVVRQCVLELYSSSGKRRAS
jgi:hypothetical protein